MLIQETIITTETMAAQSVDFQITTFEQSTFAFCDVCDQSESGPKAVLEAKGWGLYPTCQFCPNHN